MPLIIGIMVNRPILPAKLSWLRGLFGQALLTAASVAVFAVLLRFSGGDPVRTANLSGKQAQYLARLENGTLTVARSGGDSAGQLWLIPQGETPIALGAIGATLTLPAPPGLAQGILAVTATADPNSQLIASGKFDPP